MIVNIHFWWNDLVPNAKIEGILFAVLAAFWVKLDALKIKKYFPSDLVLIFAALYFPFYVFQTRGKKGINVILIFIGLSTCFYYLELVLESIFYVTHFGGNFFEFWGYEIKYE